MKLILFGSQITVGGAQRVLLDQAEWFRTRGDEVRAVFFYDKDGLLDSWRERYAFPIDTVSRYDRTKGKAANALNVAKGFFRLIRLFRREKPDAVECFTHDADVIGLSAAWLAGVPVRIGAHHGQFADLSGLTRRLHTFLVNSGIASRLVCVSERARRQALAEGVEPEKIRVIFNGVRPLKADAALRAEVRRELGLSDPDRLILNVGRLTPEKAQQHLVRAAALLKEGHPEFRWAIAGSGPLHEELARQIRDEGVSDCFTLLGNRNDIPRLLNAADRFVLYSDTEGMPVSLMEAMSIGLPCIASDLEGIAQLIPDPAYGTLIPAGDPELLARTIAASFADPAAADRGPAAAARIRASFSLDASCAQYAVLFASPGS